MAPPNTNKSQPANAPKSTKPADAPKAAVKPAAAPKSTPAASSAPVVPVAAPITLNTVEAVANGSAVSTPSKAERPAGTLTVPTEILAKHAKGEKLNKYEVQALRAVGLKKNGEKINHAKGPRDVSALNPQKLLGAVEMFGVAAFDHAKKNAETDQQKADLLKVVNGVVKLAETRKHPMAEALRGKRKELWPTAGLRGGYKRGDNKRSEYSVTTSGRGVIDIRQIGGEPGDLFKSTLTTLEDGSKVLVIAVSVKKKDRTDLPTEAPAASTAPVVTAPAADLAPVVAPSFG